MISHANPDFWEAYRRLPQRMQRLANKNYRLWRRDPHHPSLHFKKVGPNVRSVRIGISHRAVATRVPGGYVWFWIGPHDEYQRLIFSL